MTRDRQDNLVALAGPRVRSPQRHADLDSETDHYLPDHQLERTDSAFDAAALLAQQLDQDWRGLIPWSIDRQSPMGRALRFASLAAVAAATAMFLHAWWIAGGITLLAATGILLIGQGRKRRIHTVASRIVVAVAEGHSLASLEPELVELLVLDPAHDAARLLLAQLRLQQDAPLDALLQLAPLRDRHPDEGLVVVLAAVAYARIGAEQDAARMLAALRIDPRHPWNSRLRTFEQVCRGSEMARARVSSEDPEIEI